MRLKKNQTGSMLASLMVSISITILLTLLAIPSIRQYQPNLKLDAAARGLVADMRYAQQLTITEQVPYSVIISTSTKTYGVYQVSSSSPIKTVNLDSVLYFKSISGLTNNTVIFNAYGAVAEAGSIILSNYNGKIKTINVKPSGYVELL